MILDRFHFQMISNILPTDFSKYFKKVSLKVLLFNLTIDEKPYMAIMKHGCVISLLSSFKSLTIYKSRHITSKFQNVRDMKKKNLATFSYPQTLNKGSLERNVSTVKKPPRPS